MLLICSSHLPPSLSPQAHCHYVTLKAFRESIQYSSLSGPNLEIVEALCAMFAVFGIVNYAGEFMTVSFKKLCMPSLMHIIINSEQI